jgi:hypothetical protein
MDFQPARAVLAFAASLLSLAICVTPVAGYKHLGTTGNTGTHSLTDTRSSPGADCRYRFFDRGTAWELRRIKVRPPNAQASAFHEGDQEVGWRFTVERRFINAFAEEPGPWEHRYTSPIQRATTDAEHNAEFLPMDVRVRVPGDASADGRYQYRVTVKVLWYRDNGTVSGTAKMRVEWFQSFFGDDTAKQRWTCRGHFFQVPV